MSIYAHITGRLGRDAEVRVTSSGKSVTGFVIATYHGYGERKTTYWIDCALWGERGEKLAGYLVKGKAVTVHGELSEEEFTKKDGTQSHKLKLDVRGLEFGGSANDGNGHGQAQAPRQQQQAAPQQMGYADFDDDIAF